MNFRRATVCFLPWPQDKAKAWLSISVESRQFAQSRQLAGLRLERCRLMLKAARPIRTDWVFSGALGEPLSPSPRDSSDLSGPRRILVFADDQLHRIRDRRRTILCLILPIRIRSRFSLLRPGVSSNSRGVQRCAQYERCRARVVNHRPDQSRHDGQRAECGDDIRTQVN